MTTLYLVRHGETIDNAAQILQGQLQGELNEKGIQQAEVTRDKLKNEQIDVFVSSDLKRSIDTCRIIAAPHHKDVEWPENVESLEKLKSRAQSFLTYLKTSFPNKTVLAVGHGIINKAIQSVYYKKPMSEIHKMDNGEVRIYML